MFSAKLSAAISKADEMIITNHVEARVDAAVKAANKLIADACLKAYHDANHSKSGKKYAEHRAYSVPDWCKELQKIIATRDEVAIKAAMCAVRSGCFSQI